jgi:hypothetical protein
MKQYGKVPDVYFKGGYLNVSKIENMPIFVWINR